MLLSTPTLASFDDVLWCFFFFFQAEDGIRDAQESRGLGDVYKRQESLTPGLYRYVALEHSLLPIRLDANIEGEITEATLKQAQITYSAVTFIWVAVVERMYWRYIERGYRYLHLDAGHVCQNLYLAAEALNCGVCAMAAFDDEALNAVMGLDGEEQFVIYLASLGKKVGC